MQNNGDDKDKLPDNLPDKPSADNPSPKKKPSLWKRFWKAWREWWKLTFESYVVEVEDRILMSWKRIIKFVGITIIPILYGVICSVAMWNPVEALGKGTTYVMDNDYSVLLVTDSNNTTGNFDFGTVSYFNNDDSEDATIKILTDKTGLKPEDISFDEDTGTIGISNNAIKNDVERQKISALIFNNVLDGNKTAQFHLSDGVKSDTNQDKFQNQTNVTYRTSDAGFSFQIVSTWDAFKAAFNQKTDPNADDRSYKFSAPAFLTHPEVALENVHYSTDKKWNNKYYQHRKGWIQAMIPEWYTAKLINYAGMMMKYTMYNSSAKPDPTVASAMQNQLTKLTSDMKPLGLWTTYERNFLFGYMFDMMSGLLGQYVATQMPSILNTAVISSLSQYLTTDAPTLAAITGGLNSIDDNKTVVTPDGKKLDMALRYLAVDSSSLTKVNDERVKSASLFGDVKSSLGSDSKATKDSVGGKVIDTLDTARTFALSGGLSQVIKIITGGASSEGVAKIVDAIQNLVQEIINLINGNNPNATYSADTKTVTYVLNGVTFKDGKTSAEDLAKQFKVVQTDPTPKGQISATYSFAETNNKVNDQPNTNTFADDSTAKTGNVTVTINNVSQTDAEQKIKYSLTGDGVNNNMTWTQPLLAIVPKASSTPATKNYVTNFDASQDGQSDWDQALVDINKSLYYVTTGQTSKIDQGDLTKMDTVIKAIWKAFNLPGTAPSVQKLGEVKGLDILRNKDTNKPETIITENEFNKRCDSFIAANKDVKTTDGTPIFFGANTVDEVLPNFIKKYTGEKLFGLQLGNIINYKIQGAEFGYEGIGLGVFFLTVGLFVGCILHSFIFDRAKRLTKAKWSNWYLSKFMLLLTVAFFQVTAEVWVVYAAGWHAVGATAMCYIWLWLLSSDFMFTAIVQALWFSLKDEIIGKFLCVIVLVTSIAAGGGEFPAYSEFGFYRAISYVVPFTYVINGFDEIAFGISLQGTHAQSTQFMFQQWGIMLIYDVIFLAFGMLVGAQLRMKEMNYGSHYGFAVAGALRALGRDTNEFQVLRRVTRKGKKRYYYNWKALPDGFDPELYFQCRKMYKFTGEFKWWQRKHHDFVQKPNYSDEEIVTRNE